MSTCIFHHVPKYLQIVRPTNEVYTIFSTISYGNYDFKPITYAPGLLNLSFEHTKKKFTFFQWSIGRLEKPGSVFFLLGVLSTDIYKEAGSLYPVKVIIEAGSLYPVI